MSVPFLFYITSCVLLNASKYKVFHVFVMRHFNKIRNMNIENHDNKQLDRDDDK